MLFTLFELEHSSLADVQPLLTQRNFREEVAENLHNEEVQQFWLKEFAGYSPPFRAVVVAPLQNKLGALLTDPRMRTIIAAERSSFDITDAMDSGAIILANLSRGELGEGPSQLLGGLLAARFGLAGLARANVSEQKRKDFCLYLDEFQMFATESFASMLSELRKYRVGLVLANQYPRWTAQNPPLIDTSKPTISKGDRDWWSFTLWPRPDASRCGL